MVTKNAEVSMETQQNLQRNGLDDTATVETNEAIQPIMMLYTKGYGLL